MKISSWWKFVKRKKVFGSERISWWAKRVRRNRGKRDKQRQRSKTETKTKQVEIWQRERERVSEEEIIKRDSNLSKF